MGIFVTRIVKMTQKSPDTMYFMVGKRINYIFLLKNPFFII